MGPQRKISMGSSIKTTIKDGLSRNKPIIIAPLKSTTITLPTPSTSTSSLSNTLIGYSKHRDHQYSKNYPPYSHSRNNLHSSDGANQNNDNSNGSGGGGSGGNVKRIKKRAWGARERAGMSFLIVIAFFAVFGLIIITELFMIDDKNHGGIVVLRHGNLNSRLGDSMPDYDNVKEDYESIDTNFLLGDTNRMIQYRDNKIKVQAVGISMAISSLTDDGNNKNLNNYLKPIPFGQRLDTRIEETLPHYPIGILPTDGIWQVVNGTRFKFFVYSAYYDKRDGRIIRIIGATKTRGPEKVWCRLWYSYPDVHNNNRTKYYSATVTGRVKIIRENWNLKYSACFVICPLKAPGLEITPQSVSIVSRLRAPPGNILLIRNTDENIKKLNKINNNHNNNNNDKIGVCVKPFHFNYDQALYLMEYIELNTLLGISHFTFYNHTLGPHSTCVLKHYINGDIPDNLMAFDNYSLENYSTLTTIDNEIGNFDTIFNYNNNINNNKDNSKTNHNNNNSSNSNITTTTSTKYNKKRLFYKKRKLQLDKLTSLQYVKPTVNILPWDLRMRSQKEIRTEGLFAALNDCLYRNMYSYKYLALIDLDEFIMPRHNQTILELLSWLNNRYNRNAGSYSFQNAFFYLQFPDDPLIYDKKSSENFKLRAALITQRKTRRRSKLHPQKQRSKYICKPEAVVEAGNHFVWEFLPGKGSLNVPADAGILHHYRICEFGGDDCIKSPSVIDHTATKYMKRLVNRVNSVYNYLKKPCNLGDIPPVPIRPPTTPKTYKKQQNQQQQQQQHESTLETKNSKSNLKTLNLSSEGGRDDVVKVNVKQLIN